MAGTTKKRPKTPPPVSDQPSRQRLRTASEVSPIPLAKKVTMCFIIEGEGGFLEVDPMSKGSIPIPEIAPVMPELAEAEA